MDSGNEPVVIPFGAGRAALDRAGKAAAAKAAALLVAFPLSGALVTGGAAPGEKAPARLAERRAAAVTKRLLGAGVKADQLFVAVKRRAGREAAVLVFNQPFEVLWGQRG
jgi:outer membrane protein OmpA-like peptidoglycan-associated protein